MGNNMKIDQAVYQDGNPLKLLIALLIMLVSLSSAQVLAADDELGRYGDMSGRQVLDAVIERQPDFQNEYMHRWFRQIFGGFVFGTDELASEVGLVAYVLGFTNILALFLGIIIVFYTFVAGAVNTAQSGEVLGKNWSTVWLPVRTAAGFALIMPVPGVGGGVFSAAQMIIISILIMGSNAASFLWSYTADKMIAGAPLVQPVNLEIPLAVPRDILKSLICASGYVRYHYDDDPGDSDSRLVVKAFSADGNDMVVSASISGAVAKLPSGSYLAGLSSSRVQAIEFAPGGQCGELTIPWADLDLFDDSDLGAGRDSGALHLSVVRTSNGYKELATEAATQKGQSLLFQFIQDVSPIAQRIVDLADELPDAIEESDSEDPIYQEYLKMRADFMAKAQSLRSNFTREIHLATSGNPQVAKGYKEDMTKGGWAGAGRWALEISTFSGLTYRIVTAFSGVIESGQPSLCSWLCLGSLQKLNDVINIPMVGSSSSGGDLSALEKMDGLCTDGQVCTVVPPTATTISSEIAKYILNTISASDADDSSPATNTSGMVDPFQSVTIIGHRLNNTAALALGVSRASRLAEGLIEGEIRSLNAARTVGDFFTGGLPTKLLVFIQRVLTEIASLLLMVGASMFGLGFALGYLLPFLPLLTWVTQVTGYLVTAIEAVVAAPLSVILMVTPEGEGIAGTRLERAMNLLAAATLKPSLMVVGLVASVAVANVGFAIFNLLFWDTVGLLLRLSIFNLFAVLVIYTLGAYQLTKVAVSIMYTLSDNILDWFSSGSGRSFGERDVQGALDGATGAIGGQAQGVGRAVMERNAEDARDARKRKLAEDNKGEK